MNNPVIATAHFGPVYKRKIHVYYRNELTKGYRYCYSTNAHRTCSSAKNDAIKSFPNSEVLARFAKD